jgi:hypothetical protein
MREQSENVYDNKGRGQNSQGLAQTLSLNVCDAPKAHAGQIARWPECPFGTSQTPNVRGLRHPPT